MSDFIINGILIGDLKRLTQRNNADGTASIIVEHTDGTQNSYTFPDPITAQATYSGVAAVRGAQNVSLPIITSISPSAIANGSEPATLTIKGANFDPSAVISLVVYGAPAIALSTSFQNAGQLTATVTGITQGVWDVLYSDTNKNISVVQNGLVIT